jgi:hypothetical protein
MNPKSSLGQTGKVYACSRTLTLKPHFISFPELGQFGQALNQFITLLGESREDPFWSSFIRPLARYRFDLCAAPWQSSALQAYTRERQIAAFRQLRGCAQMYPSLASPAETLVDCLKVIVECDFDPMLKRIQAIANEVLQGQRSAIVVPESRLVSIAGEAIATAPELAKWPAIVARNTRGVDTYDCLIVIGSPNWYRRSQYIFSAPRASSMHVLCYDWMTVHWRQEPALAASVKARYRARQVPIDNTASSAGIGDGDIVPPAVDIDSVLERVETHSSTDTEHEPIVARLLVLESDMGVFIQAEGDATVLVIDLERERKHRVRRIVHRNVEPGHFILLRTAGGGDYVVSVADDILGNRKEELRDMQKTWKARLRLTVRKNGVDETIKALRAHGSKLANYQNLRNWMQDRTIATYNLVDFQAIMATVDLFDEAQNYWDAMRIIRRAHGKAGRRIRRQLVERVNMSNLAELERVGLMEFALDEKSGGSLTAYRIKSQASRTVSVLPREIDALFPLEDW